MYRLFIDEVGTSDVTSVEDPAQRFLSLTGLIIDLDYHDGQLSSTLSDLKRTFFGNTTINLHRRDISRRMGPFSVLHDDALRGQFDASLIAFFGSSDYRLLTTVIDKKEHAERYTVWTFHPYHYSLMVMLERYVMHLESVGSTGDVLVESRQRLDNEKLMAAYSYFYKFGTSHVAQARFEKSLTTKELKAKTKSANIAGLQMADLLAHPSFRSCHCERNRIPMTANFGKILMDTVNHKYIRKRNGDLWGWGWKWLP